MHVSCLRALNIVLIPLLLFVLADSSLAASQPQTLLEPAQLKKWIDNGYRTEKGQRVVILDVVPAKADKETWFAGDAEKLKNQAIRKYGRSSPQYVFAEQLERKNMLGHIPGARLVVSHAGSVVQDRNEGPLEMEHQVGSGQEINKLLQSHGIQKDDLIVLVSSQQNPWTGCAARLWWTLYYWGFAPEKLRYLNGGTRAYAAAGYPLQKGAEETAVTPSKITIADNPTRRFESRVSLGEMLTLVDSGATTNGTMVLLDARQPPADYYLKDERKADGSQGSDGEPDIFQVAGFSYDSRHGVFTRQTDQRAFSLSEMLFNPLSNDDRRPRVVFNAKTAPVIQLPNPYVARNQKDAAGAPLLLPLSSKGASFEGIIRGARLMQGPAYDLTVQNLAKEGNRFKSRKELRDVFAKAGIDGSKPVVVYCNTGTMASFYFYILHEVAGFENVRVYDGSWLEWGALTAYEPADTTYVRYDPNLLYPAFPALNPSLQILSGKNNYFVWDGNRFVDSFSKHALAPSQIKAGGILKGNTRWDTVHRSERVVFRASAAVSNSKQHQTFNSDNDWPDLEPTPGYEGTSEKIRREDAQCCI